MCHNCEEEYQAHKSDFISEANEIDLSINEVNDNGLKEKSYTFMRHNKKSIPLLLYSYRTHFPACLTHRSNVNVALINLMQPLVDSGHKIESLDNIVKELNFKKYCKEMI